MLKIVNGHYFHPGGFLVFQTDGNANYRHPCLIAIDNISTASHLLNQCPKCGARYYRTLQHYQISETFYCNCSLDCDKPQLTKRIPGLFHVEIISWPYTKYDVLE